MFILSNSRSRLGTAGVLLGAVLAIAGCGSSSNSSANAPSGTAASSSSRYGPASGAGSSSSAGTSTAVVSTSTGPDGTYLVGSSGRALYLWVADSNGKSNCSGACASVWPPVIASGTPSAGGGVKASDLGTVARSDGSKQVTYMGHPLYYYAPDSAAGKTSGQGSNSFGAKWWLVSPGGAAITTSKGGSASGYSSGSSGSSSGGSSYGSAS